MYHYFCFSPQLHCILRSWLYTVYNFGNFWKCNENPSAVEGHTAKILNLQEELWEWCSKSWNVQKCNCNVNVTETLSWAKCCIKPARKYFFKRKYKNWYFNQYLPAWQPSDTWVPKALHDALPIPPVLVMSTVPSWPSSHSQLQHALKSLLLSVHKFHELGQQPVKTKKNTVYTRQYHEKWTRKLQETSSTSGKWLLFEVWIRLHFSPTPSLNTILLHQ